MTTTCDDFDRSVAELALETLEPAERDALLAHAEQCRRCADELERMTAAADPLTLLAPDCEPPLGFEQRVIDAIGGAPAVGTIRPHRPRWSRVGLAAAAALLLVLVGVAIGRAASDDGAPGVAAGDRVRYSDLVGGGSTLGSVSLVGADEPGADVILTMTLSGLDAGEYHCVVERSDGSIDDLASWPVDESGFGTWALPIDDRIDEVRQVAVVDASGTTIGRTTWPD